MINKNKRLKSKKITDSAKGENCTLRIPGVCNHNPETTIPAHLNGAGMAKKSDDTLISYCCSQCHTWLDGGYSNIDLSQYTDKQLKRAVRDSEQLRGIIETQSILIQKNLIQVK